MSSRRGILPLVAFLALIASPASGQGERATVHYVGRPSPYLNVYYTSFPYNIGFQDVANSNLPGDHCDIRATGGDGVINSDDAICSIWGGGNPAQRVGTFYLFMFDETRCSWEGLRFARYSGPFGITWGGTPFDLRQDVGYQIQLAVRPGQMQDFTYTYVGACTPAFPGSRVAVPVPDCSPRIVFLHVPYYSTLRNSDEILCGVEGVDWVDANGNGKPDTCPAGIFDGRKTVTVLAFQNTIGSIEAGHAPQARAVSMTAIAGLQFSGDRFSLHAGESYIVSISPGAQPTFWNPPTSPCPP